VFDEKKPTMDKDAGRKWPPWALSKPYSSDETVSFAPNRFHFKKDYKTE
jgi:hypothetical protein